MSGHHDLLHAAHVGDGVKYVGEDGADADADSDADSDADC